LVRLSWLDVALIGGGIIVAGVVVAVAVKAKPAPPPAVVPPEVPPITPELPGIPAAIEFPSYPTNLSQLYGFYYEIVGVSQVLRFKPLTSFKGPPYPEGHVAKVAKLRVVDAAGRGVPNVSVLVWSVPTRDDQSGRLHIDGATRSEVEAQRLLTDANGEAMIYLGYLIDNIKVLEDRHDFGCCHPLLGRVSDIDVGKGCWYLPPTSLTVCYRRKDAQTDPRAYTVNARIEGTVKTNLFVVSCQGVGKALW